MRSHLTLSVFLFVIAFGTVEGIEADLSPPTLPRYSFRSLESRVLPGTSTVEAEGFNCGSGLLSRDRIGGLGVVSTFYQNGCYTDGNYNHSNYRVDRGEVVVGSGGASYPAYRVHEPTQKAREFLASEHVLTYRFESGAHDVYEFIGETFSAVASVTADRAGAQRDVLLAEISASAIQGDRIFVFVPAGTRVDGFTRLGPDTDAATVFEHPALSVATFRYRVGGSTPDPRVDFPHGPGTHFNGYSHTRQYHPVRGSDGRTGVVFQDRESFAYRLVWFDADLRGATQIELPRNASDEQLAAAASDENGNVYYFGIQAGDGAARANNGRDLTRSAHLYRVGPNGNLPRSVQLDTSPDGLNIVTFNGVINSARNGNNVNHDTASLAVSDGAIGLLVSRTMHRADDGLNHQGGIAQVLDAQTLGLVAHHGQTSGHSLENLLSIGGTGEFLAVDLGDNYPRGVHVHRFSPDGIQSRVVYTFKTEHGSSARSPAGRAYPVYRDASQAGRTYYQWSNDNRTYSEIGGIAETDAGLAVVFAGEPGRRGEALDNSRVGDYLVDSRNVGLVLVRSDFATIWKDRNVVRDDIILSEGSSEEGGFYTFGGEFAPQRNTGVVWLTSYSDASEENASRIKTAVLADGSVAILWERWSATAYIDTHAMRVSPTGEVLDGPVSLGSAVRLTRRDDPLVIDGVVYVVSGVRATGQVLLHAFLFRDG